MQLASFMSDLESSGLLGSDEPGTGDQTASETTAAAKAAGAVDPAAGAGSPATPAGAAAAAAGAAAASKPAAADAAAAADASVASDRDGGVSGGADAGEAAADGEQAEQRVLGPLQGAPEWTEVMDMGSRRVYFWNPETDAVEWDPPPGGVPRDVSEEQPAADAAQPEADTIAAAAGEAQQPGRGGPTAAGAEVRGGTAATASSQPVQPAASQAPAAVAAPTPMETGAHVQAEAAAAAVPLPSTELAQQTASLVERLRAAAGGLFAAAPKLVWLAIEAEVRAKVCADIGTISQSFLQNASRVAEVETTLCCEQGEACKPKTAEWQTVPHDSCMLSCQDLQLLGDAQRAAAAAGGGGSLTWLQYELHAAQQLAKLEAELPLAAAEAAHMQVTGLPT